MPPRCRRIQPPSPQPPQTCADLVHPDAAPERQTALALLRDLSSGQNRPIQHTRESSTRAETASRFNNFLTGPKHAPDSEPGKRDTGRWLVYGTELPSIPEVGAVCGKAARTDLGGGREVTRVPTAKKARVRNWNST